MVALEPKGSWFRDNAAILLHTDPRLRVVTPILYIKKDTVESKSGITPTPVCPSPSLLLPSTHSSRLTHGPRRSLEQVILRAMHQLSV